MRILLLNYEYPPLGGGAANATKYLLEAYSGREDIEVDLVTSAVNNQDSVEHLTPRIRIHRVAIGNKESHLHHQSIVSLLRYSVRGYKKAVALIMIAPYTGVHAFFSVPCGAMAFLLKKKFSIPYIVSLRGADVPGYSERFRLLYPVLRPIIRYIWSEANQVVANSEGLRELALKTNDKQLIGVIPNGVDTKKFFPDKSQRPAGEVIVTVGATRITSRKGIVHLIEALAELKNEYPRLRAEIMGDGSAKEELVALVHKRGLDGRVEFLGRIDATETHRYYQRASIFVLPSYNEGMSNALLEALASGLPTLVTDTGGSHELVMENQNGLYIEKKSAASITNALRIMLNDECLAEQFGEESRKRANKRSWGTVADSYCRVYREIA